MTDRELQQMEKRIKAARQVEREINEVDGYAKLFAGSDEMVVGHMDMLVNDMSPRLRALVRTSMQAAVLNALLLRRDELVRDYAAI